MTTFERHVEIAAPPARVWEVMADPARWSEWTPSVTGITVFGTPLRVGSRALIRQPKFPPAWWKVTDLQPGKEFTWVSTAPGLRVVARHGVAPSGAGTRASLRLSLDGVFGDWFGRLTREITERYLDFEAAGLKARSEDPGYRRPR
jgi:hypothetical protein